MVRIKLTEPPPDDPAVMPKPGDPAAPAPAGGTPVAKSVTLRGRVVAGGRGLAKIQVEVNGTLTDGGKKRAQTRSDEDGRFEFAELPAGIYQLKASGPDYPPVEKKIDLSTGKAPSGLEIQLRK